MAVPELRLQSLRQHRLGRRALRQPCTVVLQVVSSHMVGEAGENSDLCRTDGCASRYDLAAGVVHERMAALVAASLS